MSLRLETSSKKFETDAHCTMPILILARAVLIVIYLIALHIRLNAVHFDETLMHLLACAMSEGD